MRLARPVHSRSSEPATPSFPCASASHPLLSLFRTSYKHSRTSPSRLSHSRPLTGVSWWRTTPLGRRIRNQAFMLAYQDFPAFSSLPEPVAGGGSHLAVHIADCRCRRPRGGLVDSDSGGRGKRPGVGIPCVGHDDAGGGCRVAHGLWEKP